MLVIIDDDQVCHFLLKRMIEAVLPGLHVQSYFSASGVIDLMKQKQFAGCLIFLDIDMPGMSGWDFMETMTEIRNETPVYILSSSRSRVDKDRAVHFGNILAYIEKPISKSLLGKILSHHFALPEGSDGFVPSP